MTSLLSAQIKISPITITERPNEVNEIANTELKVRLARKLIDLLGTSGFPLVVYPIEQTEWWEGDPTSYHCYNIQQSIKYEFVATPPLYMLETKDMLFYYESETGWQTIWRGVKKVFGRK